MIKTLVYNLNITGYKSGVTLRQAEDSRNAVLAVDTSKLNGSKYNVFYKNHDDRLRFAKLESRSIRSVKIRSNSPDILITDKFKDGIPLYYKVPNRFPSLTGTLLNNEDPVLDKEFIYSESTNPVVSYSNGFTIKEDAIPVFTKNSDKTLSISNASNKTYSYRQDTNGEYIISCRSSSVAFSPMAGELALVSQYSLSNKDHLSFCFNEFSKDRIINGSKLNYKSPNLDYRINEVLNERASVSGDIIKLNNSYIISSSVVIRLLNNGSVAGEYSNIDHRLIVSNKGQIITVGLLDNAPEYTSILVSYSYISPFHSIEIPYRIVHNSSLIKLYILPSSDKIGVIAFDKIGLCSYTNIRDIGSSNGACCISSNTCYGLSSSVNTGVTITAGNIVSYYSIKDIESSVLGLLEVATITPKNDELDFVFSSRPSIPVSNSYGLRQLLLPDTSYVKVVLNDDVHKSTDMGISVIRAYMNTNSTIGVHSMNDDFISFVINTSADRFNGVIPYVNDESILRFSRYRTPSFLGINAENYRLLGIDSDGRARTLNPSRIVDGDLIYMKLSRADLKNIQRVAISYNSDNYSYSVKLP